LYCLRFLLMILLLMEMMNQSLGTCPKFGVHFILRHITFVAGTGINETGFALQVLTIALMNMPEDMSLQYQPRTTAQDHKTLI
ncbi:hypothetical protein DET61_1391, partial [Marinobacter nauticus]